MGELRDKYKNKKVFITGITGFKGSWLTLILKELGAEIYGMGLENTDLNSIYHKLEIEKLAKIWITDIRKTSSSKTQQAYTKMLECDFVFHLAAQSIVNVGFTNPILTFDTNVMGTIILQDILTLASHPITFLNITTDKVYQPSDIPSKEGDTLQGEDPYSLSKSFSDITTKLYRDMYFSKTNFVKSIVVRAGNVIGGGDFGKDRLVTDIINTIKSKENHLHLRNPNTIRPYQYVLDCLIQYLLIAGWGDETEYNIGPTRETLISTKDLAEEFQKRHKELKISFDGENIVKENPNLQLDVSRFQNEFKLKPFVNDLETLVEKTDSWYFTKNKKIKNITNLQIKEVIDYYETAIANY